VTHFRPQGPGSVAARRKSYEKNAFATSWPVACPGLCCRSGGGRNCGARKRPDHYPVGFNRSKDQLRDDVKQQDPNNADKLFSEREKDVLRDLIDQQLLLERGKDLGISGDTDLIKRLDQMRKDMKLETMEDLEKAATAQGISYEDFKQNMRNQIITQKVIGEEVGSHLNITTEEQQKFYDEHKSELEQPESIRLSEILIAPEKPAAQTGRERHGESKRGWAGSKHGPCENRLTMPQH